MIFEEIYKLSNNVEIPKLGLGTWLIDNEKVKDAVREATKIGYRHIDTAQAYGNEAGVGEGVQESGVEREKIFVTSKIAAEHKTYESAAESIDETLSKMKLSHIDLMLIHSPQPWKEFREDNRYFAENRQVWKALEDAYKAGKVRAIGVSNFLKDDLENILASCEIKPMVNQVLAHTGNMPFELIDFCRENHVLVEAYSPVAHGAILKNEAVIQFAKKYNVSVPQLCIKYVIQSGLVALPKTANPEHMKSNAQLDFEIERADIEALKKLEKLESYGEHSYFPVFKTQLKG